MNAIALPVRRKWRAKVYDHTGKLLLDHASDEAQTCRAALAQAIDDETTPRGLVIVVRRDPVL